MERNMRGHPIKKDIADEVIRLLETGLSGLEVSDKTGVNKSSVYRIAERYNVNMDNHALTQDQEREVIAMIRAGSKRVDIADKFRVSIQTIRVTARKYKEEFAGNTSLFTEENAKANIEASNPAFEYVSGFVSGKSVIVVKCRTCGKEKDVSYDYAYRRRIACDDCESRKREERKKAERDALIELKRIRKAQMELERKQKQAEREQAKDIAAKEREHPCASCGTITRNRKYCCKECARHENNKKHEQVRRAKVRGALVDSDITIDGVYQAGLGVCYICGCPCDWNDKQEKDGTIICGDRYPSIDHIVALSNGGKHSWNNVALACRRCNYLKSDSQVPRPFMKNLQ